MPPLTLPSIERARARRRERQQLTNAREQLAVVGERRDVETVDLAVVVVTPQRDRLVGEAARSRTRAPARR